MLNEIETKQVIVATSVLRYCKEEFYSYYPNGVEELKRFKDLELSEESGLIKELIDEQIAILKSILENQNAK